MGQNKNKKIHSEKAEGRNRQNPEEKRTEREIEEKEDRKLEEYGQITLENQPRKPENPALTIIGEVEGHENSSGAARPPSMTMCFRAWPVLRMTPAWKGSWFS